MGVKVVSWNIATMIKPWRELTAMDADVALLQEARRPPAEIDRASGHWTTGVVGLAFVEFGLVATGGAGPHCMTAGRWWCGSRTESRSTGSSRSALDAWPGQNEIAVSGIGTIAAARVTPKDDSIEPFIAVSPCMDDGLGRIRASRHRGYMGYADASVHRIISDLSAFIGHENRRTHRILAAGDINVTYGYGHGSGPYWDARYRNLFERLDAIGLEFMGPQLPNGRTASGDASDGRARGLRERRHVLPPR